jgi:hypothetical protein
LKFEEKEGGGEDSGRGFVLQGKVKGAFLGLRKNKGIKRKKRIKGENNKKCISITITGLLLQR